MKSSNLARRVEPFETPSPAEPQRRDPLAPMEDAQTRLRPRPGFARRTIEIRDQGFGLFRVR